MIRLHRRSMPVTIVCRQQQAADSTPGGPQDADPGRRGGGPGERLQLLLQFVGTATLTLLDVKVWVTGTISRGSQPSSKS